MPKVLPLLLLCAFLIFNSGVASVQGQTSTAADETDVQQWNDVTIVKPLSEKVDLVIPFTFRFTKNISRFNEGRAGIGISYKPAKSVTLNSTYLHIRSRNSAGEFFPENRFSFAASYKFPIKAVGLSHRSMVEIRRRRPANSWRYRPSITVEKNLPEDWIKGARVFVTEEPFYDSLAGRFSRNRLSFGFGKALTNKLNLDVYYLRQDDRNSSVRLTHVIGTAWKIKLD